MGKDHKNRRIQVYFTNGGFERKRRISGGAVLKCLPVNRLGRWCNISQRTSG